MLVLFNSLISSCLCCLQSYRWKHKDLLREQIRSLPFLLESSVFSLLLWKVCSTLLPAEPEHCPFPLCPSLCLLHRSSAPPQSQPLSTRFWFISLFLGHPTAFIFCFDSLTEALWDGNPLVGTACWMRFRALGSSVYCTLNTDSVSWWLLPVKFR